MLSTALEIPLSDASSQTLSNTGILSTVLLRDCGLVWSGKRRQVQSQQSSLEVEPSAHTSGGEELDSDEFAEDSEDGDALTMLGLPTTFGGSKAQPWHRKRQRSQRHEPALDSSTGLWYYYRESSQETQWHAPTEGYMPYPLPLEHFHSQATPAIPQSQDPDPLAAGPHPQSPSAGGATATNASAGGATAASAPSQLQSRLTQGQKERVEGSGVFEEMPLPQGVHTRFDEDGMSIPEADDKAHAMSQQEDAQWQVGGDRSRGQYGRPHRRLIQYWLQRYSLWSRYDSGIVMDEGGWYSVTPEVVALHQAEKCGGRVVVDACAGVGGNAIAMASRGSCHQVIAVEWNEERLRLLTHNAGLYNSSHKIVQVCADFFAVAHLLQADAVFVSPPWGGPAYHKSASYDLTQFPDMPCGLTGLIEAAASALRSARDGAVVAVFLPRNSDLQQVAAAVPDTAKRWEVERNVLNGHFKGVTLYIWF
ncbi:hypothetical protein WJX73_002694 [Symbiochloris irregularis]|uniref:Trimethylguanosine synthase n=1 Tax=Symbiochloris irregularis TaxID=706552 RepID=A0AAW1PIK0_9CHLO